LIRKWAWPSY